MSKQDCVLAIDQGTTSTRSIVFDRDAQELAAAREEFAQHYPKAGWVEQCPEDIWKDVVSTARAALEKSGAADRVAGIGITNQRETIVVWERATGKLSIALLSGRIGARPMCVRNCGMKAQKHWCANAPAF